jgi:hypothetical protein
MIKLIVLADKSGAIIAPFARNFAGLRRKGRPIRNATKKGD